MSALMIALPIKTAPIETQRIVALPSSMIAMLARQFWTRKRVSASVSGKIGALEMPQFGPSGAFSLNC
jgi:hypothetical protein